MTKRLQPDFQDNQTLEIIRAFSSVCLGLIYASHHRTLQNGVPDDLEMPYIMSRAIIEPQSRTALVATYGLDSETVYTHDIVKNVYGRRYQLAYDELVHKITENTKKYKYLVSVQHMIYLMEQGITSPTVSQSKLYHSIDEFKNMLYEKSV